MLIDFSEVKQLISSNETAIEDMITRAEKLKSEIATERIEQRYMKGEGAEAIGAYYTEVHGTILDAWASCLRIWLTVAQDMVRDLPGIDSDDDALIEAYYLEDLSDLLTSFKENFELDDEATIAFCSEYAEFLSHDKPLSEGVTGSVDYTQAFADNQRDDIIAFNTKHTGKFEEAGKLMDFITQTMANAWMTDEGCSYVPGAIYLTDAYLNLYSEDVAARCLVDSWLDDDGNVNFDLVRLAVIKGEGISRAELLALMMLLDEGYCTHEDFLTFCQTHIFNVGETLDGKQVGLYVPTYEKEAREVILLLASEYGMRLDEAYDDMVNGGEVDLTTLDRLLLNSQFFSVLYTCEQIMPELFDLSGLTSDGEPLLYVFMKYKGVEIVLSSIDCFLGDPSAIKVPSEIYKASVMGIAGDVSKRWQGYVVDAIASCVAGLLPPVVSAPAFLAEQVFNAAVSEIAANKDLEELEKHSGYLMLSNAVMSLGGGVYLVVDENGSVVPRANMRTPAAVVNLGLLEDCLGISPDEALLCLIEPGTAEAQEIERCVQGKGAYQSIKYEYERSLMNYYRDNFNEINAQYGGNLDRDADLYDLPVDVIEHLVIGM